MLSDTITVESVLDSIVRLTEQRNRENLEHCLVATLLNLSGIRHVTIARPLFRSSGTVIEILARGDSADMVSDEAPCAPLSDFPLMARTLAGGTEIADPLENGAERRCLPIHDGDDTAAFLVVESTDGLTTSETVVRAFASIYRNYLTILRDSERDTLTGLKNRKTFDTNISRAIAQTRAAIPPSGDRRHRADSEHHWLGIVDIDHFKRINDTYGHAFGDEVLLLFTGLMRKAFRAEDQLFRFGGEEFVVVLAPTNAVMARRAFERLRAVVEDFKFPQVGRVTASVGFVQVGPYDIPATVVGQADEALYWAKRHGRNLVCWYDDLLANGSLTRHQAEGGIEMF